jgi:hypothetical protein
MKTTSRSVLTLLSALTVEPGDTELNDTLLHPVVVRPTCKRVESRRCVALVGPKRWVSEDLLAGEIYMNSRCLE